MDFPPISKNFSSMDGSSFDFDDFVFGTEDAEVVHSRTGTSTTDGATKTAVLVVELFLIRLFIKAIFVHLGFPEEIRFSLFIVWRPILGLFITARLVLVCFLL